ETIVHRLRAETGGQVCGEFRRGERTQEVRRGILRDESRADARHRSITEKIRTNGHGRGSVRAGAGIGRSSQSEAANIEVGKTAPGSARDTANQSRQSRVSQGAP